MEKIQKTFSKKSIMKCYLITLCICNSAQLDGNRLEELFIDGWRFKGWKVHFF